MLSRMGPRNSSFPVRSLSLLILVAIVTLASGCVSYSRPYGGYGGYSGYGGSGYSGCRGSCGHGYGYSSVSRYRTVYVPVPQNVHRHSYDGRSRNWQRGWADDDRRKRDHDSHRDHNAKRGRQRDRDEDRRVGPPPRQQMPQSQRIAPRRAEALRKHMQERPTEEWRSERARRGEAANSRDGRSSWRGVRERP